MKNNKFGAALYNFVIIKTLNNYRHFLLGKCALDTQGFEIIQKAIAIDSVSFADLVILSLSEITQESCVIKLGEIFCESGVKTIQDLTVTNLERLIGLVGSRNICDEYAKREAAS